MEERIHDPAQEIASIELCVRIRPLDSRDRKDPKVVLFQTGQRHSAGLPQSSRSLCAGCRQSLQEVWLRFGLRRN